MTRLADIERKLTIELVDAEVERRSRFRPVGSGGVVERVRAVEGCTGAAVWKLVKSTDDEIWDVVRGKVGRGAVFGVNANRPGR